MKHTHRRSATCTVPSSLHSLPLLYRVGLASESDGAFVATIVAVTCLISSVPWTSVLAHTVGLGHGMSGKTTQIKSREHYFLASRFESFRPGLQSTQKSIGAQLSDFARVPCAR